MTERTIMAVVSDLIKTVLTVEQQILVSELAVAKAVEAGRELEMRDRRARNAERMRDVRNVQHVQHTGESPPIPPGDIFNIKKISPPPPLPSNGFAEWYSAYPRKEGRRGAEKAYRHALKRGVTPENLLAAAVRYARECSGRDRQFIKGPAAWLNQDCWLDEPSSKVVSFIHPPKRTYAEIKAEREAKRDEGGETQGTG